METRVTERDETIAMLGADLLIANARSRLAMVALTKLIGELLDTNVEVSPLVTLLAPYIETIRAEDDLAGMAVVAELADMPGASMSMEASVDTLLAHLKHGQDLRQALVDRLLQRDSAPTR